MSEMARLVSALNDAVTWEEKRAARWARNLDSTKEAEEAPWLPAAREAIREAVAAEIAAQGRRALSEASSAESETDTLLGCQRLGTACGLDFDEEDATLHLRRDDGRILEGGLVDLALCGTRVGWDASGGVMNRAPRCGRCFEVAADEGFCEEVTAAESGEEEG